MADTLVWAGILEPRKGSFEIAPHILLGRKWEYGVGVKFLLV